MVYCSEDSKVLFIFLDIVHLHNFKQTTAYGNLHMLELDNIYFLKKKQLEKIFHALFLSGFSFFLGQHFYKRSQYFLCVIKKTFRKHLFGIQINVNI